MLERLRDQERVVLEQVLVLVELELADAARRSWALSRDHAATAARSRSPTRYRGPVRIRASATPSVGSCGGARVREDLDDLGQVDQSGEVEELGRDLCARERELE